MEGRSQACNFISDEVDDGSCISVALSDQLVRAGLQDMQTFLCVTLGVRTVKCFLGLNEVEFSDVLCWLYRAGFGPGHACALRLLRSEAATPISEATNHSQANPVIVFRLAAKIQEAMKNMAPIPRFVEAHQLLADMWSVGCESSSHQDMDAMAARVLLSVDTICRHAPTEDLKHVLVSVQEVFVLSCARPFQLKDLEVKGVPPTMSKRFTDVLGRLSSTVKPWISKLGNTKYNLFTKGQKFSSRPKKRDAFARRAAEAANPAEDCSNFRVVDDLACRNAYPPECPDPHVSGTLSPMHLAEIVSSEDNTRDAMATEDDMRGHVESTPVRLEQIQNATAHEDIPEVVPERRAPTPDFGEATDADCRMDLTQAYIDASCTSGLDHFSSGPGIRDMASLICLPRGAKLTDVPSSSAEPDAMSEYSVCDSCAASSYHSRWGKARSYLRDKASDKATAMSALAARTRVHEILETIEEEWKIDSQKMPVIDDCAMHVMIALQRLLKDMRSESIVRAWVELLAHKRSPRLELSQHNLRDLLDAVKRVLQEFHDSESVVCHCCEAVGTLVVFTDVLAEDAVEVLICAMSRFTQNTAMLTVVLNSLWRVCWSRQMVLGRTTSTHTAPLDACAQRKIQTAAELVLKESTMEVLHETAYQVLARVQPLAKLLVAVRHDAATLKTVLSEVFSALRKPLSHFWSEVDTPHENAAYKDRDRVMLLQLSGMAAEQEAEQDHMMQIVADWVREGTAEECDTSYWMKHRMLLAGVLFDEGRPVASTLFFLLDSGMSVGYFEEDSITSALRALSDLMSLGILGRQLALKILERIRDKRFEPTKPSCHSAYIGTLAIFAEAAIASDPSSADSLVSEILNIARYWLPKWNNQGIIHEALWALNIICKGCDADLLMRWSRILQDLVADVENDAYLKQMEDEIPSLFKEVNKLRQILTQSRVCVIR